MERADARGEHFHRQSLHEPRVRDGVFRLSMSGALVLRLGLLPQCEGLEDARSGSASRDFHRGPLVLQDAAHGLRRASRGEHVHCGEEGVSLFGEGEHGMWGCCGSFTRSCVRHLPLGYDEHLQLQFLFLFVPPIRWIHSRMSEEMVPHISSLSPARIQALLSPVKAVVFDVDGTLTLPGTVCCSTGDSVRRHQLQEDSRTGEDPPRSGHIPLYPFPLQRRGVSAGNGGR